MSSHREPPAGDQPPEGLRPPAGAVPPSGHQPPTQRLPRARPRRSSDPANEQLSGTDWFVSGAGAIGASHVARHMPCQDAFLAVETTAPEDSPVVAVADGHGARRHFRSAAGARLAVEVGSRAALRHAAGLVEMTSALDVQAAVQGELTREIVRDWRNAVRKDLESDPFSPEESAFMDAAGDAMEIPYGSTLLVGLKAGRWMVCLQIGDGDIVEVATDGRAAMPVPGDPTLDGLRTTSLCQVDAIQSFRYSVRDLTQEPVLAVFLVTDGYGNAQADDPWHPGLGTDLAELLWREGPEWVSERLPGWAALCASSEGSADDTTIGIMVSRSAARAGAPRSKSQERTVTRSR